MASAIETELAGLDLGGRAGGARTGPGGDDGDGLEHGENDRMAAAGRGLAGL